MSNNLDINVEKRRDDRFRYGQVFNETNIDHMVERSPYAYRITDKIVDDAVGKGFNINETGKEELVKWYPEFMAVLQTMWGDVLKGFKFERRYGKSNVILFDDDNDALLLRVFSPQNYFVEYSKKFKITKLDAMEWIAGTKADVIPHNLTTKDELDKSYEILLREKEVKGKGMSVLEPYFDTLYSLRVLDANATRFAVKQGGGLYVANIPTTKSGAPDGTYQSIVKRQLQSIDSSMGTITLPIFMDKDGKVISKPALEQLSGEMIDFISIRDLLIGSLSAGTGFPREVLLGSELGLRSAETNQSAHFDLLQAIQDGYIPFFKWLINTLNKKYAWFTEGTKFDIVYKTRIVISEADKIDLLVKKANLISKLRGVISDEELSTMVGMTIVEKVEPVIEDDNEEDNKDNKDDKDDNEEEE